MQTLVVSATCIVLATVAIYQTGKRSRKLPKLPPGPLRLPLVGNLFNAPARFSWQAYSALSTKYGSDILYMNISGAHIVIANSRQVAGDLLEKRSDIYSGRSPSYMTTHLVGCNWHLTCSPDDSDWSASRRLLSKYFFPSSSSPASSRTAVPGLTNLQWQQPHVQKSTHALLRDLFQQPALFMEHNFRLATSVFLSSAYGLDVQNEEREDEHIVLSRKATNVLKLCQTPGRFWVDTYPILRFVPQWVSFKRLARSWKLDMKRFLVVPFVHGKEKLRRSNYDVEFPSILSQELGVDEDIDQVFLQESLAGLLTGASSNTTAALNTFILAMTCFPEAQRRAQIELDQYLLKIDDDERKIPTHADLKSLPFCMALVYEVLRWHVINPIAVPHVCTKEDIYNNYRIPKGSVVLPNVWAMMRDPKQFREPSEFQPQRFLNHDGSLDCDAVKAIDPVFGFGNRVCPGRSLGLSVLAYTACCVLALFDIRKKVDDKGEPIEPLVEFEEGITSSPLPFACSITPRSGATEKVILGLFKVAHVEGLSEGCEECPSTFLMTPPLTHTISWDVKG